MIKVLGLALYGSLAASTRYRLCQYAPGLAEQGIDLEVRSLLGDDYLRRRFGSGSMPFGSVLSAAWARFEGLRRHRADVTILYSELFPLVPGQIERAMLSRAPYIYDFDDAFYLKYRSGRWGRLAPALGNKFDKIISGAAAVTAGNRTLAGYASGHNQAVTTLPTVVDTTRYTAVTRSRSDTFTVGWIGSPSTAPYLDDLVTPLTRLGTEGKVRLVVVGGKAPVIPNVDVVEVEWNEATEVSLIQGFDVGVMPLPDDDWARGKCAFKLIQYMACGVPVIGARVGTNIDVVTPECGYLAQNATEWADALRTLRDERTTARSMGEAARLRAEEHYSLHRNLPVFAQVIRRAAGRGD